METTVYGYSIMEAGDLAPVWMPAIAANFERLSDHDHDGSDSPLLTASSVAKHSSTVLAVNWVSQGGGMYRQLVTVPAAVLEFNSYDIYIYTSTGERIYPTVIRVSATTFYIYVNDNTLALTVKYG